ncbi:MAG TPA: MarR family transcriptional regulator [Allosphingosinicella sp.]|nr:MarR family transcriptional regulator [Allosphingosinicella sp.]
MGGDLIPLPAGEAERARGGSPEAALARRLLAAQRARDAALGADLFRDVAWEILLTLFAGQEEGRHLSPASLYAAAAVPPAAARRWVKALEKQGLLVRIGDAADDARAHLYLSGEAVRRTRELLRSWL